MPRILRTKASRADYVEIEGYIAQYSPGNAARLLRTFDAELGKLSRNNGMGHPREDLAPGLRSWNVGRYVLFYRPIDDGIALIRVLHSSMDIRSEEFGK